MAEDKPLFKPVTDYIYPTVVVDRANTQKRRLKKGSGIYSVKCMIMNSQD